MLKLLLIYSAREASTILLLTGVNFNKENSSTFFSAGAEPKELISS